MNHKNIITYISKAKEFLDKNPLLLYTYITLQTVSYLIIYLLVMSALLKVPYLLPLFAIFVPIIIVISLMGTGYFFSFPILFRNSGNKKITFKDIITESLKSLRRLLVLLIIFYFFFIIIAILIIIGIGVILSGHGNAHELSQLTNTIQTVTALFHFSPQSAIQSSIFCFLSSIFVYSPMYFSLQKKGYFSSLGKSIAFTFKNLSFSIILFFLDSLVTLLVTMFIPYFSPVHIISTIINAYIDFLLLGVLYFYFLDHSDLG